MDEATQLEQLSISLEDFEERVKNLDEERSKWLLIQIYGEMLSRDNYWKQILAKEWGMNDT